MRRLSPATMWRTPALRREAAFVGLPLLVFLGLLAIVTRAAPTGFDRELGGALQSIPWGPLHVVPAAGSDIGGGVYGTYLFPAMLGAFVAARRQWRWLVPLAAVFALHYVAISPKAFVTAYRPSPEFGVYGAGGMESFPSGHVQWAASFYGLLAYMAWREWGTSRRNKAAIIGAWAAVVAMTMLGRIELGRHWPIDTMAGVLAGLITLRALVALHGLIERRWPASDTPLAEAGSTAALA